MLRVTTKPLLSLDATETEPTYAETVSESSKIL